MKEAARLGLRQGDVAVPQHTVHEFPLRLPEGRGIPKVVLEVQLELVVDAVYELLGEL